MLIECLVLAGWIWHSSLGLSNLTLGIAEVGWRIQVLFWLAFTLCAVVLVLQWLVRLGLQVVKRGSATV